MEIIESTLVGCFTIKSLVHNDPRGSFLKTVHAPTFAKVGLRSDFAETYYSVSRKNTLRGLHFQRPPKDHAKLVTCLSGTVLDIVFDLRKHSPTFGKTTTFLLRGQSGLSVYIPSGFAHGFFAMEDNSLMAYQVTSEHSPMHDSGIHWTSANIKLPISSPTVSDRDSKLTHFINYETDFE